MVRGIALLTVVLSTAQAGETVTGWVVADDGAGDLRRGTFHVADGACAYAVMADPRLLDETLAHVEGVVVHATKPAWQDVTLVERFWPVGRVESRYHRTMDGQTRVEWRLVSGRQARHDGYWEVHPDGHGASVVFQNTIEAKRWFDQPILRGIQVRTMSAIVDQVTARCAGH
jgi:hypothetical protein